MHSARGRSSPQRPSCDRPAGPFVSSPGGPVVPSPGCAGATAPGLGSGCHGWTAGLLSVAGRPICLSTSPRLQGTVTRRGTSVPSECRASEFDPPCRSRSGQSMPPVGSAGPRAAGPGSPHVCGPVRAARRLSSSRSWSRSRSCSSRPRSTWAGCSTHGSPSRTRPGKARSRRRSTRPRSCRGSRATRSRTGSSAARSTSRVDRRSR
jgi:hypothetical protein